MSINISLAIPNLRFALYDGPESLRLENFIRGINASTQVASVFSVVETANAFLFGQGKPDHNKGKRMFIRPCYYPLMDNLTTLWFPHDLSEESVPCSITGTDGTGKLSMRNLLCRRILERIRASLINDRDRATIIFQNSDRTVYQIIAFEKAAEYIFANCSQKTTERPIDIRDRPETVYYIVAVVSDNFSAISYFDRSKDKAVFFAPQSSKLNQHLFKSYKAIPLYMPLWSLGELLAARAALKLSISIDCIRERFAKVGGIAQIVLEISQRVYTYYMDVFIPQCIARLPILNLIEQIGTTAHLGTDLMSHPLVHLAVGVSDDGIYDFQRPVLQWGSQHIVHLVAETCTDLLQSHMQVQHDSHIRCGNRSWNSMVRCVCAAFPISLLATGGGLNSIKIAPVKNNSDDEESGIIRTIVCRARRLLFPPAAASASAHVDHWTTSLLFSQQAEGKHSSHFTF